MTKKIYAWVTLIGLVSIQAFLMTAETDQGASTSLSSSLVAEVDQRIETDRLQVRVYQGKRLVQLARFTELFVVTPLSGHPKRLRVWLEEVWQLCGQQDSAIYGRSTSWPP